jgi:alkanesulfonate monooxygenase SsuD/methylene tetrahydromethanopterin reductase-like flavin-dependent oxidoreductase (luciferase family)
MKLGLFQMPFHLPHRTPYEAWERDLELLVLADELGYSEAWIGEHTTLPWENVPVPELIIAQALRMTKNLVFGTGVTQLPLQHPVELAHRIAMIDHMAQGRFYWGIGVRAMPSDLEAYGVNDPDSNRVRDRGRECLEAVLGIWASEDGRFDFKGEFYEVHSPEAYRDQGASFWLKPYQMPHPPIGVASNSPGSETLRLAGERGWIPMSGAVMLPEDIKEQWPLVEQGAANAGRVPDRGQWRIARHIYVGETPQTAREEAGEVFGRPFRHLEQYRVQAEAARSKGKAPATDAESRASRPRTLESMMEDIWIVGDPDECAAKLRSLYELVGGFGYLLSVTYDPDDHSLMKRSVELLATEVVPRLKDLAPVDAAG